MLPLGQFAPRKYLDAHRLMHITVKRARLRTPYSSLSLSLSPSPPLPQRAPSGAPSLALRATASDASDGPSQQQPKQSVRKKAKRPRKHVPVGDVEPPSGGLGGGAGAGLVGDPFANLVSPVEYAELDSASAASSGEPSTLSLRSSSLPLDAAPLPEPSFQDRQRFERIVEEVLEEEKPEELPAILTKHVDFLLSVDVTTLTNDLIRCLLRGELRLMRWCWRVRRCCLVSVVCCGLWWRCSK